MANNLQWNIFLVFIVIALVARGFIALCAGQNSDMYHYRLLYYDFENMTMKSVPDESGNGRRATTKETIEKREGKCGSGIYLHYYKPLGIEDSSIKAQNVSKLEVTVAAWIYLHEREKKNLTLTEKEGPDRTIVQSESSSWKFDIEVGKHYILSWSVKKKGTKKKPKFRPNSNVSHLNLHQWVHVAASYAFNKGKETCNFFVNGTKFDGKRHGEPLHEIEIKKLPDNISAFIGSSNGEGGNPLEGIMDELSIFNKMLTEEEIQELMNKTCNRSSSSRPSTVFTQSPKTTEMVTTGEQTTIYVSKKDKMAKAQNYLTNLVSGIFEESNASKQKGRSKSEIKATEEFERNALLMARQTLSANESQTIQTSNALILMSIPLSGFVFPPESDQQLAYEIGETISFPDDMVQTTDKVQRAFVCMAYSKLHETMSGELTVSSSSLKPNTKLELNSKIIGAAVDPPLDKPLSTPITITFTHAKVSSGQQVCSFWNQSIRTGDGDYGEWSTQGCELDKKNSTSTKTVCLCNHLTNFALLLQREGEPYRPPPLSLEIITIIGCTLSILACVLCFVMFFTLKKRDIRHHLHIHLTFAIAVAQLILLCGITQTEYEVLCKIMAACLHYFYMVAFLLMLCEGVHLAILIESAFLHGDVKLPVYLVASWGLPLIIVGITLGARYDNYGGSIACFISADEGTIYAFVGPFALILLINFVILVIVLRQVIRKTSLPISSKTATKFEIARATVRSLAILFPVMGFTWVFGILFFGFRTLALQYLFAIFCSLQGFFIFLFQYALNTENRSAFFRATQRWRLTFTSSISTSGTNVKPSGSNTKDKALDEQGDTENATTNVENCHLMVYRTIDENGGTIDSRTVSTVI